MERGPGLDAVERAQDVRQPPFPDMVWIPGGEFRMGSDDHYPEERPVHRVSVDGFWIDRAPVTNDRFAAFVAATHHTTFAELPPNPDDYPGALPGDAASRIARLRADRRTRSHLADIQNWWRFVLGADWRHPQGPDSTIDGLGAHPVVHVTFGDAEAFAAVGGQVAADRGGVGVRRARRSRRRGVRVGRGADAPRPPMANTWQGEFPV